MSTTGIEWTEQTWNPVTGCTKVSPGCDHCYAERITERFHGKGSFTEIKLHPDRLAQPLKRKKPTMYFVNSMSDLFHADVPREFIEQVWDVMERTPQHTYQILTKRPGRMRFLLNDRHATPTEVDEGYELGIVPGIAYDRELPNVWLGVSVEDQEHADKRIPLLLQTPAAVRFLSCEPLLGPLDLRRWFALTAMPKQPWEPDERIHWVIVGGESGAGARPMDIAWAAEARDACVEYGIPFFLKQLGGFPDKRGGVRALLDGRRWLEMPNREAVTA